MILLVGYYQYPPSQFRLSLQHQILSFVTWVCRYESNQHNLLPTSGTTGKSVEVSVSVEILWLSANAKTLLSGKHVFFPCIHLPATVSVCHAFHWGAYQWIMWQSVLHKKILKNPKRFDAELAKHHENSELQGLRTVHVPDSDGACRVRHTLENILSKCGLRGRKWDLFGNLSGGWKSQDYRLTDNK